jgi:hypothetical protein
MEILMPMGSRLSVYVLLVIVLVVFVTCSHDDETKICSPTSLILGGVESYSYIYDADHHLTEIQHLHGNLSYERYRMTYENGKVKQLSYTMPRPENPDPPGENYVFSYGSNGKPSLRTFQQGNGPILNQVLYGYDEKERLVSKEYKSQQTLDYRVRYEYNADSNVSKIYYLRPLDEEEIVGAELLSFDNHQRFFAGSPDLKVIEIYFFDHEPSINNLLSLKIHATPRFTYATEPVIDYAVDYNGDGYVKAIRNVSVNFLFETPVFTFGEMEYECR